VSARSAATAPTGLSIRHRGTSHDSFDDGRTDELLSLSFARGGAAATWMPSVLALPVETELLGHCVRVVAASSERAVLEVALLPARASP